MMQSDGVWPEIFPCDNFIRSGPWPDPTPEMLGTVLFDTIWRVIKTWDVNVPHAYSGYMGATGNHARAIYDAVIPLMPNGAVHESASRQGSSDELPILMSDGRPLKHSAQKKSSSTMRIKGSPEGDSHE